jgi:hypothetical protein
VVEILLVLGQFLVQLFEVDVFGNNDFRPSGPTGHFINRVEERLDAVGGQ